MGRVISECDSITIEQHGARTCLIKLEQDRPVMHAPETCEHDASELSSTCWSFSLRIEEYIALN